MISSSKKETLLGQKGKVIWFTGLSASGKTTLALGLEKKLFSDGFLTQILDGDLVRQGLCSNLGFSVNDRTENIRRIAEVAKLFSQSGIVTLAAFISPTNKIRQMAREIIGSENYIEVFVSTPLEICEARDPKGLYKKARAGEMKDFTGISALFEIPEKPAIVIDTSSLAVDASIEEIYRQVLPCITL
ncbi:MAG: adenylyl-sulfate kinase [Bacteroidales bacterium]|nr:adenylyl-sulfate kinase [Bacteroidales bacterium]